MKHSRWSRAALLFTFVAAGCVAATAEEAASERTPPPSAATAVATASAQLPDPAPAIAAPPEPTPDARRLGAHDLLAWTEDRRLAVVNGATGAVRHAELPEPVGGDRDLAYDRFQARAVVAAKGELVQYSVTQGPGGSALGAREHLAWVPAGTRLLPTPEGTVVFDAAGAWSVVSTSGLSSAVPAPPPLSAWLTSSPATTVHALACGPSSGELDLVDAAVHAGAPAPPSVIPLAVSSGALPPGARLVAAPARGGALLVDVTGSVVTVRGAGGGAVGPAAGAPLGAAALRIEAAVALGGGAQVALLLSGVTEIVVLAVDPAGAITSTAAVALPGQTAPSTRILSHDLTAQGPDRIAAATDAGVFSLRIWTDPSGIHVARDPAFQGSALRGPVDAIWNTAP